ncbi:MAG TPA: alpha/beta fold hydrolase, partial [Rectinemataceae bacterium]|nr:alpha/beta fold hydrolase [Rectinemataceae bacterium]
PRTSMIKELVSVQSGKVALCGLLFLPEGPGPWPAVIVCHGAFEYKENHLALCESLVRAGIGALALDMSGHGGSGGERWHVEMASWVRDLTAAADLLQARPDIDPVRLGAFGFSSGGTAALEAALVEPRLKALATLSATVRDMAGAEALGFRLLVALGKASLGLRGRELRLSLAWALKTQHFAYDAGVNRAILADGRMAEAYASLPFPGSADCYFADTLARIGALRSPCLVLHGAEDRLDPVETGRLLYEKLSCEKRLVILARSGHFAHLESGRFELFAEVVGWMRAHLGT